MIHNLDILKGVAGRVVLCGQERDVRDLTAVDVLAAQAARLPQEQIAIASRLLSPGLTEEEAKGLTPAQSEAILRIALSAIDKLPDHFPNADGPSPTTTDPA